VKAVSLFSGAGGADLGMTEAGIETVLGVEYDASAVATCHAAGLDHVQLGDVRDLSQFDGLEGIDLVYGGPPCQAFSSAGKREGQDSELNGWPWALAVVDKLKPRWVVFENVPGLLHHSAECKRPCPGCYWTGDLLPAFRERFPWVDYRTINASSWGVPQHRRRVFLVCGPGPIRWPDATHGDPSTFGQADLFSRSLKPWVTVRDALNLDCEVYSAGTTGEGRPTSPTSPTATISGKGNAYVLESSSKGRRYAGVLRGPLLSPSTEPSRTVDSSPGHVRIMVGSGLKGSTWEATKPAPTLRDGNGTAGLYLERPSPTVCQGTGGAAAGQWSADQKTRERWARESGRRRLTVAECARLQDFPEGYPWQGTKTAQYRQVGNAWPRTFGRVLGRAILEAQ
jgi:DNA (cytosine-5)-methyltransferase 1